jgi:hypothetical protein
MEILHIVGHLSILTDMPFTSRPECLDGVNFPLLHLDWRVHFNAWHCLACMNFIGVNRMSIEISDNLDWICFALDLNLI